jgi:hypothetical protein
MLPEAEPVSQPFSVYRSAPRYSMDENTGLTQFLNDPVPCTESRSGQGDRVSMAHP